MVIKPRHHSTARHWPFSSSGCVSHASWCVPRDERRGEGWPQACMGIVSDFQSVCRFFTTLGRQASRRETYPYGQSKRRSEGRTYRCVACRSGWTWRLASRHQDGQLGALNDFSSCRSTTQWRLTSFLLCQFSTRPNLSYYLRVIPNAHSCHTCAQWGSMESSLLRRIV